MHVPRLPASFRIDHAPMPRCPRCTYSLRGQLEYTRCPECGLTISRDDFAVIISDSVRTFLLCGALALPLAIALAIFLNLIQILFFAMIGYFFILFALRGFRPFLGIGCWAIQHDGITHFARDENSVHIPWNEITTIRLLRDFRRRWNAVVVTKDNTRFTFPLARDESTARKLHDQITDFSTPHRHSPPLVSEPIDVSNSRADQ